MASTWTALTVAEVYHVNEIYYTLHGEGVRFGIPHVFVRFTGCNLTCNFCDTEYESGRAMTAEQIVEAVTTEADSHYHKPVEVVIDKAKRHGAYLDNGPCRNVLFCGGEPLLQLDAKLLELFHSRQWFTVLETNGSMAVPEGVDWITCSPKVAEHAIALKRVNELKYVRGYGQGIPHPVTPADYYLISPMFTGNDVEPRTLAWCLDLVFQNPAWRLTVQHHKLGFGGLR
jgi:organic radical activating enzyme